MNYPTIETIVDALEIPWTAAGKRDSHHHFYSIGHEISGMMTLLIQMDPEQWDAIKDDMHFLWTLARDRAALASNK